MQELRTSTCPAPMMSYLQYSTLERFPSLQHSQFFFFLRIAGKEHGKTTIFQSARKGCIVQISFPICRFHALRIAQHMEYHPGKYIYVFSGMGSLPWNPVTLHFFLIFQVTVFPSSHSIIINFLYPEILTYGIHASQMIGMRMCYHYGSQSMHTPVTKILF